MTVANNADATASQIEAATDQTGPGRLPYSMIDGLLVIVRIRRPSGCTADVITRGTLTSGRLSRRATIHSEKRSGRTTEVVCAARHRATDKPWTDFLGVTRETDGELPLGE